MDFFSDCKDAITVKARFRQLSKCFHPDIGGDSDLMIELKKQYDNWDSYKAKERVEPTHDPYMTMRYSYNPRVEILERELRILKAASGRYPEIIENLKIRITKDFENFEKQKKEIMNALVVIRDDKEKLIKKNSELKRKITELEKIAITKEETSDTLWDKIKYVMGNKAKKK